MITTKLMTPAKVEEPVEPEDAEELIKLYGTFWVWKDYFPETSKEEILDGAELLRHVNIAVR